MKWDFLKLLVGSISSIFLAFFASAKISRKTPQNAPILPEPSNPPPMPKKPVSEPPSAPQPLLWDTPKHCWHAVRVLCDQAGLTLDQKNLICAVIYGESGFDNKALNHNRNSAGVVTSTDYGICQINDRFHCGPGNDFPSVQYVLDNPDKAVEWMIKMYKLGHIGWWCAYSNGRYKQFLGKMP